MPTSNHGRLFCLVLSICLAASPLRANDPASQPSTPRGTLTLTGTAVSDSSADVPKNGLVLARLSGKLVSSASLNDGKFVLNHLPSGLLTLTVLIDAVNVSDPVTVDMAGAPTPPQLKVYSGKFTGKVIDPQGNGIPDAFVNLSTGQKHDPRQRLAKTDRNGRFTLERVANVSYRVFALAEGYRVAIEDNLQVKPGQLLEKNFTLSPTPVVP